MALNDYTRRLAQIATTPRALQRLPRQAVFMHIPKTAGSSVHAYFVGLVGRAGSGQVVMIDDHSSNARLSLARRARYIGGHFGAQHLARLPDDAYTFTYLRDPLDRLISTWRFATTTKAGTALSRFPDLETALASDDPVVQQSFDNVIARQLAVAHALDIAQSIPRGDWVARALATLGGLDHVGWIDTIGNDFKQICTDLGITTSACLDQRNVTDDTGRKNWHGSEAPAPVERTPRLLALAEPWIALDRAVLDGWRAQASLKSAASRTGRRNSSVEDVRS